MRYILQNNIPEPTLQIQIIYIYIYWFLKPYKYPTNPSPCIHSCNTCKLNNILDHTYNIYKYFQNLEILFVISINGWDWARCEAFGFGRPEIRGETWSRDTRLLPQNCCDYCHLSERDRHGDNWWIASVFHSVHQVQSQV